MTMIRCLKSPEAYIAWRADEGSLLIDVRDPIERAFVGRPVDSLSIPWKFAPEMRENPDFLEQVRQRVTDLELPLYLICRSGQRSLAAAQCLMAAGYGNVTNIEDGFEGPLDENRHRNTRGGWRFHQLPWEQD